MAAVLVWAPGSETQRLVEGLLCCPVQHRAQQVDPSNWAQAKAPTPQVVCSPSRRLLAELVERQEQYSLRLGKQVRRVQVVHHEFTQDPQQEGLVEASVLSREVVTPAQVAES
jgi:hypothetical protein